MRRLWVCPQSRSGDAGDQTAGFWTSMIAPVAEVVIASAVFLVTQPNGR